MSKKKRKLKKHIINESATRPKSGYFLSNVPRFDTFMECAEKNLNPGPGYYNFDEVKNLEKTHSFTPLNATTKIINNCKQKDIVGPGAYNITKLQRGYNNGSQAPFGTTQSRFTGYLGIQNPSFGVKKEELLEILKKRRMSFQKCSSLHRIYKKS